MIYSLYEWNDLTLITIYNSCNKIGLYKDIACEEIEFVIEALDHVKNRAVHLYFLHYSFLGSLFYMISI